VPSRTPLSHIFSFFVLKKNLVEPASIGFTLPPPLVPVACFPKTIKLCCRINALVSLKCVQVRKQSSLKARNVPSTSSTPRPERNLRLDVEYAETPTPFKNLSNQPSPHPFPHFRALPYILILYLNETYFLIV
jgi:hypothetical protein